MDSRIIHIRDRPGRRLLPLDLPAHVFSVHSGTKNGTTQVLTDLTRREKLMLVPLVILTILIGILPGLLFDLSGPTVEAWLERLK